MDRNVDKLVAPRIYIVALSLIIHILYIWQPSNLGLTSSVWSGEMGLGVVRPRTYTARNLYMSG